MVTHPTVQNASLRSRYLLNRCVEDRLGASAAGLTLVSLLALVPLMTVTLSIASALLAPPLAELFATEQSPSA